MPTTFFPPVLSLSLALALLSWLFFPPLAFSTPPKGTPPPRHLLHAPTLVRQGIFLPKARLLTHDRDLSRTPSIEFSGSKLWLNGRTPIQDSLSPSFRPSELRQTLQARRADLLAYTALQHQTLARLPGKSLQARSCREIATPLASDRTLRLALDRSTPFSKFATLLQYATQEGFEDIFFATCRQGIEPCKIQFSKLFLPSSRDDIDLDGLCGWPSPSPSTSAHLHARCWKQGSWRSFGLSSKDRREGRWLSWYPQGTSLCQGFFLQGKKHGIFSLGYPGGKKLADLSFQNGELHGLSTLWHPNGKIRSTHVFRSGKRHGPSRFFDPQGRKIAAFSFVEDRLQGAEIGYPNGTKKAVFSFAGTLRQGRWMQWYPDGSPMWERIYSQGRLTSSKHWHPRGKLALHALYHASPLLQEGQTTSIQLWNPEGLPCGAWLQRQTAPAGWKREIFHPCPAFPRHSFTPAMQALARATNEPEILTWLDSHLPPNGEIIRLLAGGLIGQGSARDLFSGQGSRSPLGSLGERESQRTIVFGEFFAYGALEPLALAQDKSFQSELNDALSDRLSCVESLSAPTPIHVEFFFQIEGTGRPSEIRVERMNPSSPRLEACLTQGLSSLRFPPPSDGGIAHLFLPLVFAFEPPKTAPPKHDPRHDSAIVQHEPRHGHAALHRSSATSAPSRSPLHTAFPAFPSDAAPSTSPLNLVVALDDQRITLTLRGRKLSSCDGLSPSSSAPTQPLSFQQTDSSDHASLRRCLSQIKSRFPRERRAILSAPSDLPFFRLIQALQTLQTTPEGTELFPLVTFAVNSL